MSLSPLDRIGNWNPYTGYGTTTGLSTPDYKTHRIKVYRSDLYNVTSNYAELYRNVIKPGATFTDWDRHVNDLIRQMDMLGTNNIEMNYCTNEYSRISPSYLSPVEAIKNSIKTTNKKTLLL